MPNKCSTGCTLGIVWNYDDAYFFAEQVIESKLDVENLEKEDKFNFCPYCGTEVDDIINMKLNARK